MGSRDPLAACQKIGDDWLARGSDLVLRAPSVVIPEEFNTKSNLTREVGPGANVIHFDLKGGTAPK